MHPQDEWHDELLAAAGDFERWPGLLERFAAAHGAIGAALVPAADTSLMRITPSVQAPFQSYVDDGVYLDDKRLALMPKLASSKVVDDLDAYSTREMAGMAYYSEWLPAQRLGPFAALRANLADPMVVALYRERGDPPFDAEARLMLEPISDAMMRAVALDRAVGAAALRHRTDWHERTGAAVIGLDRQGRVTLTSAGVARFLGAGLHIRHGRLVFADAREEEALGHALQQSSAIALAAALGRPHARTRPDRVHLRTRTDWSAFARGTAASGATPMMALDVHPVAEGYRGMVATAHLVVLSDPFRRRAADRAAMVAFWDLTAREAELVAHLVDGLVLAEAAAQMGLREGSARTYLKTIYRKTGARAQSELVALAARITANTT